jgi:CPA1 family monovalent cation:H+ antiporter
MEKAKAVPIHEVLVAIALTSVIVVAARFLWVFPWTYLTRIVSSRVRRRDPPPPWRYVVVIGFTGIRGVVSLAVALALPLTLPNGEAFPYRDLIQLTSFGVIFVTLFGIGLTLPFVVNMLGISRHGHLEALNEREAEIAARRTIIEAARGALTTIIAERKLPEGLAKFLEARHETRMRALPEPPREGDQHSPATKGSSMVREIITSERQHLHRLLREGKITDETRRRIERDLDLEEAVVDNREKHTPL